MKCLFIFFISYFLLSCMQKKRKKKVTILRKRNILLLYVFAKIRNEKIFCFDVCVRTEYSKYIRTSPSSSLPYPLLLPHFQVPGNERIRNKYSAVNKSPCKVGGGGWVRGLIEGGPLNMGEQKPAQFLFRWHVWRYEHLAEAIILRSHEVSMKGKKKFQKASPIKTAKRREKIDKKESDLPFQSLLTPNLVNQQRHLNNIELIIQLLNLLQILLLHPPPRITLLTFIRPFRKQ